MTPEFKDWAKHHNYRLEIDKEKPEIYKSTHTQSAWEAWKAAKQDQPQLCPPCNQDCNEGRDCPARKVNK